MFFLDTQQFVFGLMAQNIGCFATPDVFYLMLRTTEKAWRRWKNFQHKSPNNYKSPNDILKFNKAP